jgi:hypothetical protein
MFKENMDKPGPSGSRKVDDFISELCMSVPCSFPEAVSGQPAEIAGRLATRKQREPWAARVAAGARVAKKQVRVAGYLRA